MVDRRMRFKDQGSKGLERGISSPAFFGDKASTTSSMPNASSATEHEFERKTFMKPTCCHYCTEMLWGLKGQGQQCKGNVLTAPHVSRWRLLLPLISCDSSSVSLETESNVTGWESSITARLFFFFLFHFEQHHILRRRSVDATTPHTHHTYTHIHTQI